LREVVRELPACQLALGWRVTGVEQDDARARVAVAHDEGETAVIEADYVVGCDGPRSTVRKAIGSAYQGAPSVRPNLGAVFRFAGLWEHVPHGRALQYWVVNPFAPGVMGPLDGEDLWWIGFVAVDRERGARDIEQLITYAVGTTVPIEVLS